MVGRELLFQAQRSLRQLLWQHACRSNLAPCMIGAPSVETISGKTLRFASTNTGFLGGVVPSTTGLAAVGLRRAQSFVDGSDLRVPSKGGLASDIESGLGSRLQDGAFWPIRSSAVRFYAGGVSADSNVIVVSSDEEYQKELATSSSITQEQEFGATQIVVTQFTAQWCGPCRMIAPYLDKISKQLEHVKILQIDIDEPNLTRTVQQAEVSAVPTFQFHKKGELVSVLQGADPRELVKRLTDLSGE